MRASTFSGTAKLSRTPEATGQRTSGVHARLWRAQVLCVTDAHNTRGTKQLCRYKGGGENSLVDELFVQLFALLDDIVLLKELLQGEVLGVEEVFYRRSMRKAHAPEHGCAELPHSAHTRNDASAPQHGAAKRPPGAVAPKTVAPTRASKVPEVHMK